MLNKGLFYSAMLCMLLFASNLMAQKVSQFSVIVNLGTKSESFGTITDAEAGWKFGECVAD